MGVLIPEAAGIRGNLIGKDHLSVVTSKFDLKVDQVNVQTAEIFLKYFIYQECISGDIINLFLGCKVQRQRIVAVDERISQIIVLVAEFQGGAFEL